jgi:nucleoside-diphosphate-sugar epimerase
MTVYGPGRDQGLTSGPTKAILAAVIGRPYEIAFGGRMLFQYVEDVARTFIAASRSELGGARVLNLPGSAAALDELVRAIEEAVPAAQGLVSVGPHPLPYPDLIDCAGIEALGPIPVTPLVDAVRRTATVFRDKFERGELDPAAHGL